MGSSQSELMGPSGSTRLSAEAAHSMRAAWAALIASDHSHSIINKQVNFRKNSASGELNRTRPLKIPFRSQRIIRCLAQIIP